jgi:hypothetical protein
MSITDVPDFGGSPVGPGSFVVTGGGVVGAGVTFTFTNTARLTSIFGQFSTSATAANRTTLLRIRDNFTNVIWQAPFTAVQIASQVEIYEAYIGASYGSESVAGFFVHNFIPLPADLIVESGWVLDTFMNGLQVGDQWQLFNVLLTI